MVVYLSWHNTLDCLETSKYLYEAPFRSAWLRDWVFFICVNAWKRKKSVNAWNDSIYLNSSHKILETPIKLPIPMGLRDCVIGLFFCVNAWKRKKAWMREMTVYIYVVLTIFEKLRKYIVVIGVILIWPYEAPHRSAWLRDCHFFCVNAWKRKKTCMNAWNVFHTWCVKSINFLREFVKTIFFLRDFVKRPIFNQVSAIFREKPYFSVNVWMREIEKKCVIGWLGTPPGGASCILF